jgi:ABC-type lipoprotein release transport system permease subunit
MMAVAIPIPYPDDVDGGGDEDGVVLPIDLTNYSIQLLIEQNTSLRQQVQLGKKIIGAVLILMIICIAIFIMNILHFTYIS